MQTTLSCREMLDFLADYLDGELAQPVRADFEAHLRVCPECVDYIATYNETVHLERDAWNDDETAIPDALVRAILASQSTASGAWRR